MIKLNSIPAQIKPKNMSIVQNIPHRSLNPSSPAKESLDRRLDRVTLGQDQSKGEFLPDTATKKIKTLGEKLGFKVDLDKRGYREIAKIL